MQILWPWFAVAQAALLPALVPGTEVRLVSPDLIEVYAYGTVQRGLLVLEGAQVVPGTEVRLLILPPDADAPARAAAAVASGADGAPAPRGRVAAEDVLVEVGGAEPRSLRALLAEQGIEVRWPGEAQQ